MKKRPASLVSANGRVFAIMDEAPNVSIRFMPDWKLVVRDVKMTGGKVGMAHHRCYRNKASVRYLFTGRSGIEVADMEKGWLGNNSWIRGSGRVLAKRCVDSFVG